MYHLTTEEDLPIGWSTYKYIHKDYRVNYSVKQTLRSVFHIHNEFWMIWTDITPLFGYVTMAYYWTLSDAYKNMSDFYKILGYGAYLAAIMTRLCSSIYHIFNPISLYVNQTLINIDYVGIMFMTCGFSWVYVNALDIHDYRDSRYIQFISGIISYVLICNTFFIWLLMTNNKKYEWIQMPIILSSATVGTWVSSLVIFNNNMNDEWRYCCGIGTSSFIFGYVFFYILHFPECILKDRVQTSIIMYSHIWWHNIVTLGQTVFLYTTFLDCVKKST
jgi:predicted membrane channel-forming protein YqfA (hemolysin III family)